MRVLLLAFILAEEPCCYLFCLLAQRGELRPERYDLRIRTREVGPISLCPCQINLETSKLLVHSRNIVCAHGNILPIAPRCATGRTLRRFACFFPLGVCAWRTFFTWPHYRTRSQFNLSFRRLAPHQIVCQLLSCERLRDRITLLCFLAANQISHGPLGRRAVVIYVHDPTSYFRVRPQTSTVMH